MATASNTDLEHSGHSGRSRDKNDPPTPNVLPRDHGRCPVRYGNCRWTRSRWLPISRQVRARLVGHTGAMRVHIVVNVMHSCWFPAVSASTAADQSGPRYVYRWSGQRDWSTSNSNVDYRLVNTNYYFMSTGILSLTKWWLIKPLAG